MGSRMVCVFFMAAMWELTISIYIPLSPVQSDDIQITPAERRDVGVTDAVASVTVEQTDQR